MKKPPRKGTTMRRLKNIIVAFYVVCRFTVLLNENHHWFQTPTLSSIAALVLFTASTILVLGNEQE